MSNDHARIRTVLLTTLVAFSVACQAQSSGEWPGVEWTRSTPEAEGIDPGAIDSLVADIGAGAYGLIDAFLLIRNGRVVADHRWTQNYDSVMALFDTTNHQYNYDHPAWHPYYQNTDLHTMQSVTKSVTSAALGVAVDEGLIDDVHVPVMQFFGDYGPDVSDPRKDAITLEDMLTMRTGIAWRTEGGYGTGEHSTDMLEASDTWIQYVIDQPMDTTPGSHFEYNDGVSVLLGKILRQATGMRADEWARERLFAPIGITEFFWKITPDGEADTEGGLYLRNTDLARIGYLLLRGGEWNGERILSEEWVAASISPIVADVNPSNDRDDPGYGYQWWILEAEDGRATVFAGNGYGGQFLMVAPDYDIVVVFNGWNIHGGGHRSTWRALQERILQATSLEY